MNDATKPGYYRTRDGRIALVAGYNPKANGNGQVVGWIEEDSYEWAMNGSYRLVGPKSDEDLVSYIGQILPRKVRPFKVGDVTKTRDGRDARVICVDRFDERFGRCVIAIKKGLNSESLLLCDADGRSYKDEEDECDLMPLFEEEGAL